ncbi:MAG: hypothetical protein LBV26_05840 [Bacteroidales bacterium]|jgi:O-antigen/teichoic acid export membrane protein|nr:hypothetical protein [Bacteroidales bacterium]
MQFSVKIKNKLKRSIDNKAERSILKNIVKLIAGDGIARVIGFITTPIITRIYLPEQMGILSVFVSLLALMAPFSTLRYSTAIPLPRNDRMSFNLTALSFIILCGTTVLIFAIYPFCGKLLLSNLSAIQIHRYWYIIPIAYFAVGLYEILTQWALRKKQFAAIARTKVTQKLAGATGKIVLGLCGLKPFGLLAGEMLTQMGGVIYLLRTFIADFRQNIRYLKKSLLRFSGLYYIDFPRYRLPSSFLLVFSAKMPLLYFAWKYGAEITGQLSLSVTMLSIPVTLVCASVGKAFYAEISTIGRKAPEQIYSLTASIMKKLFLFSFIPFIIIFISGPWIFKIIFGEAWLQAGVFARILSFCLLMQFVYSPISDGIVNVFNRQNTILVIEIIRTSIITAIFLLSYFMQLTAISTLVIYSAGLAIHYIIATGIIFQIINIVKPAKN